jgi:hypothetical protein
MGMATNIIVFLILFSFGYFEIQCGGPVAYPGASCPFSTNFNDLVYGFGGGLFATMNNFGVLIGGAAIIGTLVFPNPYTIFLGIALIMLGFALPGGTFCIAPSVCYTFNNGMIYTLLSSQMGLPGPVADLLKGLLIPLFIIAIISWYAIRDVF